MRKRNLFKIVITYLLVAIFILTVNVPTSYAATTKLTGAEVPDQFKKGYDIVNCLDISRWQSDISEDDWQKIHDSGVDAVIIRAGYSSYDTEEHKPDKHFKDNITNASKAGLDVGVYYFSAAINKEEAKSEAEYFVKLIEPYRDKITLPVVLDFESNERGRLNGRKLRELGMDGCTEMCEAFLQVIDGAGYDPMIYANRSTLDNYLDHKKLEKKYKIWLAQYSRSGKAPTYEGDYYMWQYSSDVRLSGIKARVDANYLFKEDAAATAKVVSVDFYVDEESENRSSMFGNETNTLGEEVVGFVADNGVSSKVPIDSNTEQSLTTVVDKTGLFHGYNIYKAEDSDETEASLATLFNGYFRSKHEINTEFVRDTVLSKVLGEEYTKAKENGKSVSLHGIATVLTKLKLRADYYPVIDDEVYTNIKSHLAQGKPVFVWVHTNNDKWGNNKNQAMLLLGLDADGYAIMADPVDREWSGDDQRIKLVSVTELVEYMKNGKKDGSDITGDGDGGYLLIDRN
ncbi:MAG: glycoside hydrolase family 25 protein [Eubacterium sp.]|nr:glycoside hydrolase family 25 protein [Candidatus Colimonas fimequi]